MSEKATDPQPPDSGTLLSIQVGKIRRLAMPSGVRVDFRHPNWSSGIFKDPVSSPVSVTQAGIVGDEQADLDNHGGPDNVVLAYDAGHYPEWRRRLNLPDLSFGAFGENFTVQGFTDEGVCIGDIWSVGPELLLQVTQARMPCYKLARRLEQPHIVKMIHENSRGGWYLRVLNPGTAESAMPIRLIERRHPQWPVARAVQVMYARNRDRSDAQALGALPELSTRWKEQLMGSDE